MSYYKKPRERDREQFTSRYTDGMAHFPEVRVNNTGTTQQEKDAALEKALNIFKKIVARDGVLQELKDRAYFKSPGQKEHDRIRNRIYKQGLKKEKKQKFHKFNKFQKDY